MKSNSHTIAQTNIQSAPSTDKTNTLDAMFTSLFRQRHDALVLIKQLIQMIKSVQRHRAMSMGLLGGNCDFRDDLSKMQYQLANRFQLFMAFANQMKEFLSTRDHENLRNAWLTISHDWQQDSVIDNYELHCHLIEHLLTLVARLAKHLEEPMSTLMSAEVKTTPTNGTKIIKTNRVKQLEVLHFSTRLMPAVAEQIGRIRALATYVAALGYCDTDYASKLRYVIQCTKVNNEKLRHQAKRMESIINKDSPLLNPLKSYEIKLTFLLNMIEQDVLKDDGMTTADSNRLYEITTNIIDMYLHIVDEGVLILERWHQDEIEDWLTLVI
ncbi:MAG: hypothetical protein V4660_11985 [Pseudomonadota bacterium]